MPVASRADGSTPSPSVIWAICSVCTFAEPAMESKPTKEPTPSTSTAVSTTQRRNCVRATQATPIILPNISSVAFTEDTSTSTTRLDFSSMTLCITIAENIAMNIYIIMESTSDIIMYTSEEVIFSSPESSSVKVETGTSALTSSIICLSPSIL